MLMLDHARLVRREHYEVRRFRQCLLSGQAGEVTGVLHKHDRSCCRQESWDTTADAIIRAVRPPRQALFIQHFVVEFA
jgi:hypothetical protein